MEALAFTFYSDFSMESTPEQTAEGEAVVRVLAAVLDRLVNANAPLALADAQVTKFHALRAPSISILQYLERIHKYASCSTESFVLALIFIDRLIQRNNFLLTHLNVHRVVISAVLVAAKFFDDAYYNNAYYAKVGGVLVSELNSLEVEFLFRINFALHVGPELYRKYQEELLSHAVTANSFEEVAAIQAATANLANASRAFSSPSAAAQYVDASAAEVSPPVHYVSASVSPFVPMNNTCNQSMGNQATVIVAGPSPDADKQMLAPSPPVPSPNQPYYGQAPQYVAIPGYHVQHTQFVGQAHNGSNALSEEFVSNLAVQLQHHHLYQVSHSSFPQRAASATVSLSDADENEQYYQQQQYHAVQYVHANFPVYVSSGGSIPSTAPVGGSGACSSIGNPSAYRSHSIPQQHHQAHMVESVYVAGGGMR